ncbi:MAG TPA: LPXTG cell wall anchor domain-containing protein [Bacteroidales bacterium]|jgi:LPXTG-motif cell wall-anchored protein|nr:LPXTG cell wall anchor domain-containing protein [Bacteroidales bacterium]HOS72869.1 LPXTG cell wall anchor domain-containing protein [Bacteroidales bacterium]HQH25410.1 LPXTG cell wall anchor domain-containing protein [Bacteroidales bacterium]HQJ83168.1 LPXTG cell wall anchor domain-containing protein [Bacteroidales bacterium]
MKKALLTFSLVTLLVFGGLAPLFSQEQPRPQKDTVNIDTDAKPTTYYDIEDENLPKQVKSKGSGATVAIIAGAVVVAGAVAYFLLRKKK